MLAFWRCSFFLHPIATYSKERYDLFHSFSLYLSLKCSMCVWLSSTIGYHSKISQSVNCSIGSVSGIVSAAPFAALRLILFLCYCWPCCHRRIFFLHLSVVRGIVSLFSYSERKWQIRPSSFRYVFSSEIIK